MFLKEYLDLRGPSIFPPWIKGLSDLGGCFRFGQYKWVDSLERLTRLEARVTRGAYKRKINKFKKEINGSFEDYYPQFKGSYVSSSICVCVEKSAVQKDLDELIKYLKGRPEYNSMARGASNIIQRIQSNTFTIKSQAEAYCAPR